MENASKALIIAGAILLSILIIGLGMFIYNQAAGAMGNANLDSEKVTAYNSKFEQYEGTQSGTNARALCDLIRNHNNANVDDSSQQVQLTNSGTAITTPADANVEASTISTIKNGIKQGKTYTVSFGYDPSSGFIVGADIVEKK